LVWLGNLPIVVTWLLTRVVGQFGALLAIMLGINGAAAHRPA
jgi:hypothetical protein